MNRSPVPLATIEVPSDARDRWCVARLTGADPRAPFPPLVTLFDASGTPIGGQRRLRPTRDGHAALLFVPQAAATLRAEAPGTAAPHRATLTVQPLPRWRAALTLLAAEPRRLRALLAPPLPLNAPDVARRLRHVLNTPLLPPDEMAREYPAWVAAFDTWTEADIPDVDGPTLGILLLTDAPDVEPARRSLASLTDQWRAVPHRVTTPSDWRAAAEALGTDHIGLLAAGEVLPPHATALARAGLRDAGWPALAIADEDSLDEEGARRDPLLKPRPNAALMMSGILSHGLWIIRRDVLLTHGAPADSADALRLALWFRHREATGEDGERLPYLLSHRAPGAEAASPESLAAVVNDHARRAALPFAAVPATPLRLMLLRARSESVEHARADVLSPRDAPVSPGSDGSLLSLRDAPITALVPSTLRPAHALSCITAILAGTDHDAFSLRVGVSQPAPIDADQSRAAEEIARRPNATVHHLPAPRFNFAWVNNRLAEGAEGDILLLNDDVSPIGRDWLRWMAGWLADSTVGAVGARLLYPNNTVQHGGVIMGLGGICEHAHRDRPADDPGYMHRAVLAGELSAVTAACMLVRRAAWDAVGGMDEGYPSAFNDVDLCLRLREAGYRVIYAPAATLHHHELKTYGNHFAGERAAFAAAESARMRARWSHAIAADPFHDPNLSLEYGQEWQLALPPRITPG